MDDMNRLEVQQRLAKDGVQVEVSGVQSKVAWNCHELREFENSIIIIIIIGAAHAIKASVFGEFYWHQILLRMIF